MDEPVFPNSALELRNRLLDLLHTRHEMHVENRKSSSHRKSLSQESRRLLLEKNRWPLPHLRRRYRGPVGS